MNAILKGILCLFLLPGALIAQTVPEVPRFAAIAEGLYRGGQPDKKGFEFLRQKGIKTVINFRTTNDESEMVTGLGMNYVWIPVSIKPWSKIPTAAIEKYLEIVNNPENYPIFFHCRRGADRTGAMAAFYRMSVQGWDAKKAYSEARAIGMRWWYPAMKKQIHGFTLPSVDTSQTLSYHWNAGN